MNVLRDAANILDISEYDVLYQAYQHWYGKPAPGTQLNRAFSDYLKTQQPPHWARHYALHIITNYEAEMHAKCKCFGLLWLLMWHFKSRPVDSRVFLVA
jgi:hypothetical protein